MQPRRIFGVFIDFLHPLLTAVAFSWCIGDEKTGNTYFTYNRTRKLGRKSSQEPLNWAAGEAIRAANENGPLLCCRPIMVTRNGLIKCYWDDLRSSFLVRELS